MQKDNTAAEEEMRKLQEELKQKEERVLYLSNKIDKTKMQDADMAAELRSFQPGEERRGRNASQTGDGCMVAKGSNVKWERHKGRCQEEKKEEAVKTNKSETRQDRAMRPLRVPQCAFNSVVTRIAGGKHSTAICNGHIFHVH